MNQEHKSFRSIPFLCRLGWHRKQEECVLLDNSSYTDDEHYEHVTNQLMCSLCYKVLKILPDCVTWAGCNKDCKWHQLGSPCQEPIKGEF